MNGLWFGKTGEANAWYHIQPFVAAAQTRRLHVVRPTAPLRPVDGIELHTVRKGSAPLTAWRMRQRGRAILQNEPIDYIVSFNPVPWGTVAWTLARAFRKPLVLGFIGKDFYCHLTRRPYGPLLLALCRQCPVITVTGQHMRQYFVEKGIPADRIETFPHCVPEDWFVERDAAPRPATTTFDLITVASLEPRKRVDDVLRAVALLPDRRPTLCVVGAGAGMPQLRRLAHELGIADQVTFTGFQLHVRDYLMKTAVYVQASCDEGLSLGLVEALACGLVPVTTEAGSERDHIRDDWNGRFVPVGDPATMAACIDEVLEPATYQRLQNAVFETRDAFHLSQAIAACERILDVVAGADNASA
jgi:glycosyltransferase involved in cell wall biosynthesis